MIKKMAEKVYSFLSGDINKLNQFIHEDDF